MKVYSAKEIRNVAVLGHSGCGKTALMEAALHVSKVTKRMGRVEDGNTISDYDVEENRRGTSVNASIIPIEWDNSKINFIDTPGFFDFAGAVRESLRVADAAIIVADARSGIQVGTELAWDAAEGLPKIMYINGIDDEHVDYYKLVGDMREKLSKSVAPLMLPFKENGKVVGYVNSLTGKAHKYTGMTYEPCDFPADMQDLYEEYHQYFLEAIAESDDRLMEKFFADEKLTDEEFVEGLNYGIAHGTLTPVLLGTATTGMGISALLEMITTKVPSASKLCKEIEVTKNGEDITIPCDEKGEPIAFVFKTISDPFVGRLSLFRVYSGVIKKDTPLFNVNSDAPEKVSQLFVMRGKEQIEVSELRAGDIGAIAKLAATNTGDTLATKNNPVLCKPINFPSSLLAMAITAKNKGDEDKLSSSIPKVLAEDKTLQFKINKETKQTLIYAIGDGQLDVLINRLKTRYKLDVELSPPIVPYRETIKGKSDVKGKFVKQSGGGGQYGIVDMRFEPSGDITKEYVFDEVVVGGSVPKNYFPAVEKGIQESVKAGPVAAYPVVGIKAVLYDGKYHAVDSSELAFKMAAKIAFKDGFMQAKPALLEPIMKVVVTVPDDYTGDIMGDMNKRRGRILGMEMMGKKQVIQAEAPHSEMLKYAIDLRSMTQGRGSFTMEFERYEEAPSDVQTKVIAARKKELDALKDD
ncbi:MAG: elongation factor G [Defluviitaleaceae bacterium]|nr:elongation factor G [Defluviitaleaceae bacterium]